MQISRTEQKRQARQVEELARELAELPASEIAALPADQLLKQELAAVGEMKAGARKRQIKFIARELRTADTGPLLAFLARRRGSKLQQDREFQELERLREAILDEAIRAQQEARATDRAFNESTWNSDALSLAGSLLPGLEEAAVKRAASRFAATRKPAYRREIFRQLKAAAERRRFTGG